MSFKLDFDKNSGLIPAIAQDAKTGKILMLAYINQEAWELTLKTGIAHYWSRSRNAIWKKGESSGNIQTIVEILTDCDQDTIIYRIEQKGKAACHLGYESCFFRKVTQDGELETIAEPIIDPKKLYNK